MVVEKNFSIVFLKLGDGMNEMMQFLSKTTKKQ